MLIYISIDNSDDKLTQSVWASFCDEVADLLYHFETENPQLKVHGKWYSAPDSRYQNACFCVELMTETISPALKEALAGLASEYDQDSIAWAECPMTEFIQGS